MFAMSPTLPNLIVVPSSHLLFPSPGLQVLSALIHLLGCSFLAHCFSRRVSTENLTAHGISQITWPRLAVILLFIDSWLFLLTSGVLIFGIGLQYSPAVCASAIYICIACYGTSKFFIYAFLIEKVHVVWAPQAGTRRLKSPIYILCLVTVTIYIAVALILIIGRIHYFQPDGACVIGLKRFSSLTLLSYDLYVNIFLTTLFLWPLFRSEFLTPRVRRVASRTLFAAGVALTTSTCNVVVLTAFEGHELGWVCLGSCGTDVIFNAFAIFWVTARNRPVASVASTQKAVSPPSERQVRSERAITFAHTQSEQTAESKRTSIYNAPDADGILIEASTPKSPSLFNAISGIWAKGLGAKSNQPLEIHVTTEYEMEDRQSDVGYATDPEQSRKEEKAHR